MQIFVKLLSGKTLTIDVQTTDTIAAIKNKIQAKDGPQPSAQRLVYSGNNLEDARTLGDYDIPNQATVYLIDSVSGMAIGAQIQVAVVTSTKERLVFQVDPNSTPGDLAVLVKVRTGIPDPVFYLGQNKLNNGLKLSAQGVTDNTTLQTVVATHGGS